ncbi:hypothetical protein [Microbulbifer variabilis]|uniref:hypothetical protein n=1 Tax=Microbulbifer variabilis TaxID=266805 RepID=UPI0012FA5486|nr:hypothetical protein [Microbulbifer variabilis]
MNSTRIDKFPLRQRTITGLLFFLLLSACSNHGPIPGMVESFQTEIAPNGAKRFTFSINRERRDIPAPVVANTSPQRRTQNESVRKVGSTRRVESYFDWALEQKMLETGFCTQGYFEIERTISEYGGEVRGECREGAF